MASTLLVAGLSRSGSAQVSSAPPAVFFHEALTLDLTPAEVRPVRVTLAAGLSETLSIEQSVGAVQIKWDASSPSAQEPRTNPAGLHSQIRLSLISQGSGSEELSIRNLSATKPASVTFTATEPHPATADDRLQVEAESALALAESLRAQRKPATYPDALRSYDSAIASWRQLHDDRDLARALVWKALFHFLNQSDATAALPLVEEAAKFSASLDVPESANLSKVTGYVHVQLAQYDAGRIAYTAAIRLFEQTHDFFNQEVLLDNLSRVERLQGNTDAALADAERADALAGEVGDPKRQLKIKAEIGAVNLSATRLEAAYAAYQSALLLLQQTPDTMTEGYIWSDLGVLYTLLHQPDQARDALDQAMAVWKRSPDPTGEVNTLDDFGELWMGEHKLPLARTYYSRGLALATHEALPRDQIYLLRGLGATYLLDNNLPAATENLNHALQLAVDAKEGDSLSEIHCLMGDLYVRQRKPSDAAHSYSLCRQTADSAHDAYNLIRAEGSLARLELERGNLEAAAELSERALARIEAERQAIPEQDLRTSFFSSMRSYYDLAIDVLEALDRLHPDGGYQWQAFLTAERARARMLLDLTAAPREARANPALIAERDGVDAALRNQQKNLSRAGLSANRTESLRRTIARMSLRRDALSAEIAASTDSDAVPPPALTPQAVQTLLPPGRSALLEYWTGERGSFLWSVTHSGVRSFRIPSAGSIESQTAPLLHSILSIATRDTSLTAQRRASLIDRAQQESAVHAAALRKLILPAGAVPSNTHVLLVVEDGPLLSAPLSMVFRAPKSAAGSSVAGDCDILTEPSAAFLTRLLARPATAPKQPRIAIFAGLDANPNALADLPFVAGEMTAIQTIFGHESVRLFSGAQATPKAIRSFNWDPYSIGHFATHATLDRQNMQLTGLVLASSGSVRASDVSTLWYGDVCKLHARLDLVVLSACDTANGANVPGEGLVGLTQAFFTAGSQRVLGTLWPVDDQATSMLMEYFYTSLQATRSAATALRLAQQRMASNGPWQSPYYWSGFSLAGDWRKFP